MGILRASTAISLLALAACGSDHAKVDAGVVIPDATPDAKVWQDAPPGPNYDLSCLNGAAPTTAADPISIAGTTQSISQSGSTAVTGVTVDVFKSSSPTSLGSATSGAGGAFSIANIATGGTPIEGYLRGAKAGSRTAYVYPGRPVDASLTGVPVLVLANGTFDLLTGIASVDQDDDNNGALVVLVTDCSAGLTPIEGATLQVKQGGTDVGTIFDLGALSSMAAGTFFVFNVPDGATDVLVSYNGMAFPTRSVLALKKPAGQNEEGTLTVTQVRPGP